MRRPPRLVTRTLAVTFGTVAVILSVVFIVLMVDARDRVRAAETEKLQVAERVFAALEARRQREQLATIATIAENPTLKAALDTYFTERSFADLPTDQETSLRDTVTLEAEKLAALTRADVLAILDVGGYVFTSAGPSRDRWPREERITPPIGGLSTFDDIVSLPQPSALTVEEYEQLKRHPALGARILRQVPFLAPHIPIVELHHEQPDGRGYPFGLRGDEIPVTARIAHVADAFDAMVSARAYRPAREPAEAVTELQRHAGTQFDPAAVEALLAALPLTTTTPEPALQELLGRQAV